MIVNVHEIKFDSKTEFAERFNKVSDAYAEANKEGLSKEESDKAWQNYFDLKLALEQGYPM